MDVGTGPGFLAQAIAETVGTSGSVCGVDISEALLNVARSQNKDNTHIEFAYGDASLAEFHRVLRKGGKIALLDTDWDSLVWHSSDRIMMNRILAAWEAHAANPFLPRTLAGKMKHLGFQIELQKIIPINDSLCA